MGASRGRRTSLRNPMITAFLTNRDSRQALWLRPAAIAVFAAILVLGTWAGQPVLRGAWLILLAWLFAGLLALPLSLLARNDRHLCSVRTLLLVVDVAAITGMLLFMPGAWRVGIISLFVVTTAAALSIPRAHAVALTALALLAIAAIIGAEALGLTEPSWWAPVVTGHWPLAIGAVAAYGGAMILLTSVQHRFARVLQRAEERQRLLLGTAEHMILTLDRAGLITSVNRAALESGGFTPEEALGRSFTGFVHPDDLLHVRECFEQAMNGTAVRLEARYVARDEQVRYFSSHYNPITENGRVTGVMVIAEDVTQQRETLAQRERLLQELAQSQQMQAVGMLVSRVAHELNNPLATILTFAEEMRVNARDPDDGQALQHIVDQSERARGIVKDLVNIVNRRNAGEREPVMIGEVLDAVTRVIKPLVTPTGTRLERLLGDDVMVVKADRAGLEQVVTNLVKNAVHAAGSGGTVTLRCARDDDRCEIIVEDSGPGISAASLPRLFEPFFSTWGPGKSAGLGLPVARAIVERHEGTLRAENRAGGDGGVAGARFVVSLPLAKLSPRESTPTAMETARPAWAVRSKSPGVRVGPESVVSEYAPLVLVVDDEATIRAALRRFFTRRGWRVDEAEDGRVALELLLDRPRTRDYDVVICDLRMPECSGIEVHDRIASSRPDLLERLIFATGDVVSPESRTFLAQTRRPVLEKPFDLSVLAELVQRVSGVAVG